MVMSLHRLVTGYLALDVAKDATKVLSLGRDDGDDWLDRLSYLGRAAKPLMPALIEALASKQEAIRDAAISAIADLGPHAKDTLPALRALEKTATKQPERLAEAIKHVERKK